jgi:hypothetical protein
MEQSFCAAYKNEKSNNETEQGKKVEKKKKSK